MLNGKQQIPRQVRVDIIFNSIKMICKLGEHLKLILFSRLGELGGAGNIPRIQYNVLMLGRYPQNKFLRILRFMQVH